MRGRGLLEHSGGDEMTGNSDFSHWAGEGKEIAPGDNKGTNDITRGFLRHA